MGAEIAWFGPRLDTKVSIHVRRQVVVSGAAAKPPLRLINRNDSAVRLFLWCVFFQAVGEQTPIRAVELAGLIGHGKLSRRLEEGATRIEVRRVDRALALLRADGLVKRSPDHAPLPSELIGCGVHIDLAGTRHAAIMRPGHEWRRGRDLLIPAGFWTQGWVAALSAADLIGFIGLLARGADRRPVAFRGRALSERIGISGETWRASAEKLTELGLIDQSTVPGTTQSYRYRVQLDSLKASAT